MDTMDNQKPETGSAPEPYMYILNGSFSGHALAGGYMLIFGLIWSFSFFYRYFSVRATGLQYRGRWRYWLVCKSRTKQQSRVCFRNVPVESCLQVAMGCAQLALELIQGYGGGGSEGGFVVPVPTLMHISMCLTFIICGLLDFAVYNPTCCANIPKRLVYYTGALTFGTAGVLFATHLHHGSSSNTGLHVPATVVFLLLVVVIVLESFYTTSVVLPCLRSFLLLVAGLQLIVIGCLVKKSESVPDETILRLTSPGYVFLWLFLTVIGALVFMVLSGLCARVSLSGKGGNFRTYHEGVTEQLLDSDSS